MPTLLLQSNVKIDDVKAFSLEFSQLGANVLKKPLKYMAVSYSYNESLSFGGTFDPAFVLSVHSLGNISPEKNVQYSKALFEFLQNKLGVPGSRGYIVFDDPTNAYMGHEGTTFATIFG